VSATGNVTGGNIITGGLITATGAIQSTANVVGGNISTGGLITATGNITGGNVNTAGRISATGNLVAGNISSLGALSGATVTGDNLSTTGNLQIGASLGVGTPPSGTTGEIRATNNITAFFSSDSKFKENIRPIPDALDKVIAIGGKLFDWTNEYVNANGGEDGYFVRKSDFGVIAQDVQQVFPLGVRTRPDGTLAVDYEKLAALAFAAIIELNNKIGNNYQGQ
jgi:hypothetical protein